jgi:hypothetical protein
MPPGNRRQTHGDSVSNKYTGLILQFANAAVLHADDLKYQTYGLAGLVLKRTYSCSRDCVWSGGDGKRPVRGNHRNGTPTGTAYAYLNAGGSPVRPADTVLQCHYNIVQQ